MDETSAQSVSQPETQNLHKGIEHPESQVELQEKEAKRQEVLKRWENAEQKTDEELLDAMRQDGQILVHVTGYAQENIKAGYFLPTLIRNLREGKPLETKALQHSSEGLHFSLNEAYIPNKRIGALRIENRKPVNVQMIAFVSHPGTLMTKKDISFGSNDLEDISERNAIPDVVVHGRTDDEFDQSSELKTSEGYFLIPTETVNPTDGKPTTRLSLEQYMQAYHIDQSQGKYVDNRFNIPAPYNPDQCAVSSQEYWQKINDSLPENQKSRFFFYEGDDINDALRQFREKNQIPGPDAERFVESIKNVGAEMVIHGDSRYPAHGEGTGEFIRLKSNDPEAQKHITVNPKRDSSINRYYNLEYIRLKNDIDDGKLLNNISIKSLEERRLSQVLHVNYLLGLKKQGDQRVTDEVIIQAKDHYYRLQGAEIAAKKIEVYAQGLEEARKKISSV